MRKNKLDENSHLQYWDVDPPSKRDALIMLMKTLALLSEALPIALENVPKSDMGTQIKFWIEFSEFERSTDFYSSCKDDTDIGSSIATLLEDWREIVEIRVTQPTGELKNA